MYHITGFSQDETVTLCAIVVERFPTPRRSTGRKRALGLYNSVVVALTYLRRNHVQQELEEFFDTSQSTISRAITTMTPLLAAVLADWVPTADDLNPAEQLINDGTLLSCWSWKDNPELYSGKHRTTGVSIQVACSHYGALRWLSDPMPGKTHDAKALRTSGLLDADDYCIPHIGDKGYIGLGMLTPYRKPPGGELAHWQKEHNAVINSVRAVIERFIAQLKTWRIFHTDYRRPLKTFPETISTVIALKFYRTGF